MTTGITVEREAGESNASVLRRFSRRVQGASVLRLAKSLKHRERAQSHFKKKKAKLKRISRFVAFERDRKLGKVIVK